MVVILKVGGQVAAAECIRHAMAQQGLPWRLVHVSSLNQARLALARERADLLLIHHQLPDGTDVYKRQMRVWMASSGPRRQLCAGT